MSTWAIAAICLGPLVGLLFIHGAKAKPTPEPRRDLLIRVYSDHGSEVWLRSERPPGPRAVLLTQHQPETRDDAAMNGAASVS